MMSSRGSPLEDELGDQAYAVLTIVALRGEATPYDVERSLDQLAGEFWSMPHVQVYRVCRQLSDAGLLRERQEPMGRRRRVYALTKTGRERITAWVRSPTDRSIEVRDVAQLKLMASEFSTAQDVRRLAEAQIAAYRRRLEVLRQIEERSRSRRDLPLRFQGVAMGRAVYEAALAFWTGVARRQSKS